MRQEKNTRKIKKILKISMNCKLVLLLSFFCIIVLSISAQDVYPLHPTVGDTIDKYEKLDYSLFPSVKNNNFQFAVILYETDQFYLETASDSFLYKYPISQAEIVEQQQNIEKINAYYRLKEADTSQTEELILKDERPTGKDPVYLNEQLKKQISKDARMRVRLKEDRERMLQNQRGIPNNQLHIEFK